MPRFWLGNERLADHGAIIFDLDGTLIHSAPDLQFAANEMLKGYGREPLDLATVVSFIGNGVERLVARCLEATGGADESLFGEALEQFLEVYSQNVTRYTRPYAGVLDALEQFQASGIPMGICTNKPTGPAVDICEALDLTRYFDVILGAEPDLPKKPDKAPLMRCIQTLDATPSTALYVGDSSVDFETARNAQVPFRLFSGGYLNSELPTLSEQDRFSDWAAHGIVLPQG